jgi:hypothetical protein
VTRLFSPKDPSEIVLLGFNFAKILSSGEVIVSATWEVTNQESEVVSEMLVGAVDITAAPIVRQAITGGAANQTYRHRAIGTTNLNRVLVAGAEQKIVWGWAQ